jgi:hypothetical protein
MTKQPVVQQLADALDAGGGILHLAPAWVPRAFLMPGRRLRLAEPDLYALGVRRGGIDERWVASTTPADNGPGTPADEGLSYVAGPGGARFLLRDAIAEAGAQLVGREMLDRWGRWPVLCKLFDNIGPIPHHLHQRSHHAALVGAEHKPEAYYFPPQYNNLPNAFPYTFFGLEPGTTRSDVIACLERWERGDNGILDLSRAYRLTPGTGWLIPPGILHAPGSLCTYEVQWGSDVFAMFQSMVEDRPVGWELLTKDVPPDHIHDLDFIVDLIDWDANLNPVFKTSHFLMPVLLRETASEGYQDRLVIDGTIDGVELFSAREMTVQPGASVTLRDGAACGVLVVQGYGTIGPHAAAAPGYVRYGELTADEFFVSDETARAGWVITNTGQEPFVVLRHFGPGGRGQ